ncbi:MAG: hypothetical protein NC238_14000 [Dehalobacter sp.]|nr:hypothetical protein [Dehalobacter sp.]
MSLIMSVVSRKGIVMGSDSRRVTNGTDGGTGFYKTFSDDCPKINILGGKYVIGHTGVGSLKKKDGTVVWKSSDVFRNISIEGKNIFQIAEEINTGLTEYPVDFAFVIGGYEKVPYVNGQILPVMLIYTNDENGNIRSHYGYQPDTDTFQPAMVRAGNTEIPNKLLKDIVPQWEDLTLEEIYKFVVLNIEAGGFFREIFGIGNAVGGDTNMVVVTEGGPVVALGSAKAFKNGR